MMASRKARLWDAYAERWRAMTKRADGRLNDAFMALFAAGLRPLERQGRLRPRSERGAAMSWYAKVNWSEGLFLRPHHLQQADRYLENAIESRTRHVTPYPWGFAMLETRPRSRAAEQIRAAAGGGRHARRRACSIFPPTARRPRRSKRQKRRRASLSGSRCRPKPTIRAKSATTRPITRRALSSGAETVIDSTSHLRIEEEIDVAYPRLAYEIRKTAKPGYVGLPIARIVEVHDRTIVFDEKFAPPLLMCAAHPTVEGWLDRVIGWIGTKLDELARYASDATAGGGLQSADYLMLQMLNREIPVLKHFRRSRYVHPERLYEELLRIAGELATFATAERRAREYPAYVHDDLEGAFAPVLRDIQDFLSARLDRRAIRLELIERAPERLYFDDQGPHPVSQRDPGARSFGAPPAHRNSAEPAEFP